MNFSTTISITSTEYTPFGTLRRLSSPIKEHTADLNLYSMYQVHVLLYGAGYSNVFLWLLKCLLLVVQSSSDGICLSLDISVLGSSLVLHLELSISRICLML